MKRPVYLDNHATTRVDPRVVEAMMPYFSEIYGNAASVSHSFGWQAREAVDRAREQVARLIGADAKEVVFTSGATEANNLAIKGVLGSLAKKGKHLVTSLAEHRAVLDPMRTLGRQGWDVTFLKPDGFGMVTAEAVREVLREETGMVSVMAANNEVGTINPVGEIGRICRDRGILFHSDATQAVGRIPLNVREQAIDLMSFSAHKMYGPKGVGALYVRRVSPPIRLSPQMEGGGHERGMRSGTLPVPLIVGFGEAAELALRERDQEAQRIRGLRDRLQGRILEGLEAVEVNGHPTERLPGNLNVSFRDVDGEALMMAMKDVCVSSGSACTAADPEPSHVLMAMGVDEEMARASLRFGLGRFTTEEEVDFAAERVIEAVTRLRGYSAAWSGRTAP